MNQTTQITQKQLLTNHYFATGRKIVEKHLNFNQKMTKNDLEKIIESYKNTDYDYYSFLFRLILFCTGDFYPMLEKAEQSKKKLYLIKDSQHEMEEMGLMPESFILVEDLGIK